MHHTTSSDSDQQEHNECGSPSGSSGLFQVLKLCLRGEIFRGILAAVSMFGQVDAIGQIAGGPDVGLIGTLISIRAALLATCAILFPNVFFFARARQLSKRDPVEVEEEEYQLV